MIKSYHENNLNMLVLIMDLQLYVGAESQSSLRTKVELSNCQFEKQGD